jgi:hypothetical protein
MARYNDDMTDAVLVKGCKLVHWEVYSSRMVLHCTPIQTMSSRKETKMVNIATVF